MKIIGPSQYLFRKRMNCQNSLKIENREKKLINLLFCHSESPQGTKNLHFFIFRYFALLSMTPPPSRVILSPTGEESLLFCLRFFTSFRITPPIPCHSEGVPYKGVRRISINSSLKSFHSGLTDSIKLIFLLLNHPLICFSLVIALLTSSVIS